MNSEISSNVSSNISSIDDIKHALYINLQHRVDRKQHVERQLASIGLTNFERFDAIKMKFGPLGCGLSHLNCLTLAKENNWDHVLICEDDIQFLNPLQFTQQLNMFFKNVHDWDVILLGGNNIKEYTVTNDYSVKVSWCQTTTGYIVKQSYYDKLIDNFSTSTKKLALEPYNHGTYAIDQYWTKLQCVDNWFLITPLTVVQRDDYSDIEKRRTNYKSTMLKLDKTNNNGKIT
jgi:glycosyl transferase family 25